MWLHFGQLPRILKLHRATVHVMCMTLLQITPATRVILQYLPSLYKNNNCTFVVNIYFINNVRVTSISRCFFFLRFPPNKNKKKMIVFSRHWRNGLCLYIWYYILGIYYKWLILPPIRYLNNIFGCNSILYPRHSCRSNWFETSCGGSCQEMCVILL